MKVRILSVMDDGCVGLVDGEREVEGLRECSKEEVLSGMIELALWHRERARFKEESEILELTSEFLEGGKYYVEQDEDSGRYISVV